MAVHATTAVEATAEIDLWVPRDTMADLESGVRTVVRDVDGVETAEVTGVTDVTPRATDIRVTATVWLVFPDHSPETTAVRETLEDGFGIMDADVPVAEPADA
ncbi:Asp23/Gls24 family envelope stress response protein [Halosimplex salinum]|uniref:hypothetical protein n=1 Tax=Halosimplex salinum TaxID=1710538 RepID=UPI0013DDE20E|nr:hypothetical protein [Halosimplex salinum]